MMISMIMMTMLDLKVAMCLRHIGTTVTCAVSGENLDFDRFGNKGADQLCSNCTADLHLCFRYKDTTILPLLKSYSFSYMIINFPKKLQHFGPREGVLVNHQKPL